MAQGLFGGATSYEKQSLMDIKEDINNWVEYIEEVKIKFDNDKKTSEDNGFWLKVPFNFKGTLMEFRSFLDTMLEDFEVINKAINENDISKKDVKLFKKIGNNSIDLNRRFGTSYHEDGRWKDYGNEKFSIVEDMYAYSRDLTVTLQDASNAADRMDDYVNTRSKSTNEINVSGNMSNSQIQQDSSNSYQKLNVSEKDFDYKETEKILLKIKKETDKKSFEEEVSLQSENIAEIKDLLNEILEMVKKEEEPSKIKNTVEKFKNFIKKAGDSVVLFGIEKMLEKILVL